ncbi:hypothetical protein IDJ81_04000 [Tsuneonella flava]|uniref:Uncharacterized protein n=1 Tax=Tsuneonella flava TaxID=2055955 RepID=A0ABX7KBE7_9SPHN|nr:hypothetical protein [Tsuneonella flava]QSB45302.1 hypothetical protein IDJ81_04000 [Tsuneonella flava]
MSSSAGRVVRYAIALAIFLPTAAYAQDGDKVTAEQAIDTAKQAYGPPAKEKKSKCPAPEPGGPIVVCGELEEQSQFRVKSSMELDPSTVKDIVPRAPDFEPHYPGPVVARGCFVPPCPKPMPVMIDLKAIPEAPPGSDADRVARGLAPRGYDGPPPAAPKPGTASGDGQPDSPVNNGDAVQGSAGENEPPVTLPE